ncbi:uncharacterized protein LOC126911758 [Spodoptera frugiperda]|uniref:Uncharacterized protein LOC126911758 n=1 Tax=Spodoptera frugiperda TaxID=7108 RepID=A0A9R0E0I1_SPOFR|nr:uncharacterized protein LOC126911758 [Spodoptera frugiperda]
MKTRSFTNTRLLLTENKVVRSGKRELKDTQKQFLKEVKAHLSKSKLFRPPNSKMTAKQKILKQIVEGSSYSDEEESLQKNLIEALHKSNRDKRYKHGTVNGKGKSGKKEYLDLTRRSGRSGVKFKSMISLIRNGFLR